MFLKCMYLWYLKKTNNRALSPSGSLVFGRYAGAYLHKSSSLYHLFILSTFNIGVLPGAGIRSRQQRR